MNLWYTKFSTYRTLAKKLNSLNKRLHLDDVERRLNRYPKIFWMFATELTRDGAQGIALQNCTDRNVGHVFSSAEVENALADYFSNLYTIGPQVALPCDAQINSQDTFSGFRVDYEEIVEAIRHLNLNLPTGADLIASFVFEGCLDLVAPILKHILNVSLCSSAFPLL